MMELKETIYEIKNQIHDFTVNNVNNMTKKQFDILREVEVKLNDFISEDK